MDKIVQITLDYNSSEDILNIAFGPKAREAISVEQDEEVFLRITPDGREIVGMTILGFKKYLLGENDLGHDFSKVLRIAGSSG